MRSLVTFNSGLIGNSLTLNRPGRLHWAALFILMALTVAATAQTISASAQLNGQAGTGGTFDYTITLNNSASSSAGIQTFWYAWTPSGDYLPSSPSLVTPPTGWTDAITHFGAGDGWGIEFSTTSAANAVAPGQFLDFNFESIDTPTDLAGNSPFYPGTPVGRSVVYEGAAFTLPSATIDVQSVPEPTALGLFAVASLVLLLVRLKSRPSTTGLCRAECALEPRAGQRV